MDKPIEYEFTLPDGSKRYEIVADRREVFLFQTAIGATSAKPLARNTPIVQKNTSNFRRRYALAGFTVERTAKGWQFCRSGQEKEKGAWSRPYSSIASVTLTVARQLRREVERRDAPYNVD